MISNTFSDIRHGKCIGSHYKVEQYISIQTIVVIANFAKVGRVN